MKRFWKYVTGVVPAYGLFPLVFSFVFNCLVYSGSRAIAGGWYHHNIESSLDLRLPFVPQFLIVYFGCYIFWAVNYILAARQEKEQVYRFFTADLISRCVCLIIFLAYPTTNTRPVIEGSGFWDLLAGWLYSIDAADNLFPSIHCLVSWLCFLGIKDQKRIPAWYKGVSFVLAVGLLFILDFKFRKPTNRELVIIVAVVAVAVLLVLFYNEGWWKFNYLYKLSMERGGNL